MTELGKDAAYVNSLLFQRLPNNVGPPLRATFDRDLTIVSDKRYYETVAQNTHGTGMDVPLPGLELDDALVRRKEQVGVAVARKLNGVMFLNQVMEATYEGDTARSLFRNVKTGSFIPIDTDDTPDSLFARTGDYVEKIFIAAGIERIPLSKTRRDKGVAELTTRFQDRDTAVVLDLTTLAGRNSARLRTMWLGQFSTTTRGFRYLSKADKNAFLLYAAHRPAEYIETPDLFKLVAARRQRHRSNSRAS